MPDFSRRGFLAGIFAAATAPAIVKAGIIMPIKPQLIVAPPIINIARGGLALMMRDTISGAPTAYRWVRTHTFGELDQTNIDAAITAGWMPVREGMRPGLIRQGLLTS